MQHDAGRSEGPGFGRLREDAARLLAEAPDGLDAGALAQALFGTVAGERWVPLLGTVLGGDERLRQDDGRWLLVRPRQRAAPVIPKPASVQRVAPLVASVQIEIAPPAEVDDSTIVAL